MAEKNILMQRKNADGTFDVYYPKTKGVNVLTSDGSTVEDKINAHMAEKATETKLGHVKAKTKEDGTLIIPINILDDDNVYNAALTTKDVTKALEASANYGGTIYVIATDDNYVYVGGGVTKTVKKLGGIQIKELIKVV